MKTTTNMTIKTATAFFLGIVLCTSRVLAQSDYQPVAMANNANAKIQLASDVNINAAARPINPFINQAYPDLKPALAPLGNRIYFSRLSNPANTNGVFDQEDIWYADYDKDTETWSEPARMTGFLNNSGPNFINNVSVTGDTLILGNQYLKKGKMKAGLSYSVNVNGQWSFPTTIHIKNDYNISEHANAFVALKTGIIIQAIQRCETQGGRDLYVSFWDGKEATEPINMGAVINSSFDESSPYLAADNKTLYFASKGHAGYGGYDIYVTERLDDSWTNWSKPRNLGPAVNGNLDDEFFSISHCGKYATLSKQISAHNTDIYKIATKNLFKGEGQERKQTDSNSALASL